MCYNLFRVTVHSNHLDVSVHKEQFSSLVWKDCLSSYSYYELKGFTATIAQADDKQT